MESHSSLRYWGRAATPLIALTLAVCGPQTGGGAGSTGGEGMPPSPDQTQLATAAPAAETRTTESPASSPPPTGVPGAAAPARAELASAAVVVELAREPATVVVPLSPQANQRLLTLAGEPGRLRLVIEGLTLLRPGVNYQVYLNLPAGSEPQPGGPHFLGHVALFAEPQQTGEVTRSFDITDQVQALRRQGQWTGSEVRVTFVPAAPREVLDAAPGSGPVFRFRRIAIVER